MNTVIPIRSVDTPVRTPLRGAARHAPKGRQVQPAARERVLALCAGLAPRADLLIEHLHRLQDGEGALRHGQLAALAEHLRLSQVEVFEVASFYHHFEIVDDEAAVPATVVRVCNSLSCTLAGSETLMAELQASLAHDASVRVQAAPCIGQCHRAPAACVGQRQLPHASVDAVQALLARGDTGPRELPVPDASDLKQLQRVLSGELGAEQVLAELKASNLRGLGGAGFPAWRKWETVRAQSGPRHMVVNIDEGEVGTFKDGHVLTSAQAGAPQVLEGLLIAAQVVGIDHVWLYLRDEYHDARVLLQRELDTLAMRLPALTVQYPGYTPPIIELRRGAGAYICGEESALIESVEGKRGLPRLKPPIVALHGVFGRPTLAHNPETLWWLPEILAHGAAWLTAHGRAGRNGLRRFSVSGRVKQPGVYLAPAGITLRELIDEHAGGMAEGHTLYAYLPGGASGGILPAALADVPLDFDTLAEHGAFVGSMAVVVLGQHDKARDAALNLMRFFEHESCGQCTPCRAGTTKAVELIQAPVWDAALLAELSQVMRDASICGLGQAAPNPVDSVLRFFSHEVRA
ncbi:NADH-ubiquinone oxidoreductase-F iron-sulfur binding region domain-containing protein [Hydrogenophaga sp. PBL-H3]|uniref:NADH-ubiquinone oxidoreductase-F iron-sulfur binding region domain-containing protein n=1 Tax=Hydrogenophaga sp. PBL-H3 TaxID=434010 RepID=UPI00131FA0FA|nr:NADH-ubiquinone oxidoreductase-F iron-sulfur binding region domain-containing protein [Hydrogenophaga sp. PBL-H3]QHE77884.1 NADH-quinone oxidoreductase subunit F [Hydrogenophaga sp. PBL-H3]QHE82308.1 NADH-quinone oxidoreductase subunit F [Hydrogenophaga sp. PBL-H3]